MDIVSYTKSSLAEFLRSELFQSLENIPINPKRGLAHVMNPRAAEGDTLLIAAYHERNLVGYLGILPDLAHSTSPPTAVGWMTCLWVKESSRGRKLAWELLQHAVNAWNGRLCVTRMVPWLETVFQRLGIFHPTMRKKGLRAYLRMPLAMVLPPRRKLFYSVRPLLHAFDCCVNTIHDPLVRIWKPPCPQGLTWEVVGTIPEDAVDFIERMNCGEWTRRGREEFDWILRYPWVVEAPADHDDTRRYYFSSRCKRFFLRCLCVRDKGDTLKAFALVQVRNSAMTVPYVYAYEDAFETLAHGLFSMMQSYTIDTLTSCHPKLSVAVDKLRVPFIHKRATTRVFLFPKCLPAPHEDEIQDGDGDGVFT
ncbi:MAG: GNAT family N-acetyltransferase [Bacteroidota bacterium]|nr:GNAT family N-acetyltransferase [Bacteroidota bacterium]